MPFVIGEGPANWGETITGTCTVLKGDHPIQIEWAFNGEPISRDHPDITIVSTSKRVSLLTIDAVTAQHAGEYTCTASNVAGGTSYSASVAVNGIKVLPTSCVSRSFSCLPLSCMCNAVSGSHDFSFNPSLSRKRIKEISISYAESLVDIFFPFQQYPELSINASLTKYFFRE